MKNNKTMKVIIERPSSFLAERPPNRYLKRWNMLPPTRWVLII